MHIYSCKKIYIINCYHSPSNARTYSQPLVANWTCSRFVINARPVSDKIPVEVMKKLYWSISRDQLPPPCFSGSPHCKHLLGHPSKEGVVFKRGRSGNIRQRYCRLRDGCLYLFKRKVIIDCFPFFVCLYLLFSS